MVERDNSAASPVLPGLQYLNQMYLYGPQLVDNSSALNHEEPSSKSMLSIIDTDITFDPLLDVNFGEKVALDNFSFHEKSFGMGESLDLDESCQPLSDIFSSSEAYFENNSPLSFWRTSKSDVEKMKIDDIFQVDEDVILGIPTLAELNANDESLFDSFDISVPIDNKGVIKDNKQFITYENMESKMMSFFTTSEPKQTVNEISTFEKKNQFKIKDEHSLKMDHSNLKLFESNVKISENNVKNDPIKALDNSKKDKEINLFSSKNLIKKEPSESILCSSLESSPNNASENVTCVSSSSNLDDMNTEDDSDMDDDYSSDGNTDDEVAGISAKYRPSNSISLEKKRSRYFWQYNMQAKGPKGSKVKLFDDLNAKDGVGASNGKMKRSGKIRRGDGNDFTPNPKKLYNIGVELENLNNVIDGLIPVNELPVNARTKSRKEKNKLASRACRLKKKAQHEANKLKLYGLQQEQKSLLKLKNEVKLLFKNRIRHLKQNKGQSVAVTMEALQMKKGITKVAGCSADYVNNVLKSIASDEKNVEIKDL